MPEDASVEVSVDLAERVRAIAAGRGLTPGQLVNELLNADERRQRFDEVRAGYTRLPADDNYWAELAAWDATNADGLSQQ